LGVKRRRPFTWKVNHWRIPASSRPARIRRIGEEVVPVATSARAEKLTKFQGAAEQEEKDQGSAKAAAAEAFQGREGSEHGVRGEVLNLVVHVCPVDQADDRALRTGEAADDDGGERYEPDEA